LLLLFSPKADIYHSMEGRRPSWPGHCRRGAHSPCLRLTLYIAVVFMINITAHSMLRS